MLIVQKFGGTSVANAEKIARAADAAVELYRSGAKVVTVVSAQGDATDVLLRKAQEIAPSLLLKSDSRELDALLATVQMPSGIPVATVAVNGAKNAAILAVQMLAINDEGLAAKLSEAKQKMIEGVKEKDRKMQEAVAAL